MRFTTARQQPGSVAVRPRPQTTHEVQFSGNPAALLTKKAFLIPAFAAAFLGSIQATTNTASSTTAGTQAQAATCQDDGRRVASTPIDLGNLNTQTITEAISTHTANLADYAKPAVVKVETDRAEGERRVGGHGGGFICRADGLILTNWHVVQDAVEKNGRITVRLADGRYYPGTFVAADPKMDIAAVRIRPESPLPTLRLADSDQIRVGDYVAAFGHPFGFDWNFTSGTVTARRPETRPDFDSLRTEVMQTDTSVAPGNSGGPLLNRNGEVTGLATAIYGNSTTTSFGNMANHIKRALWRIENNKTMDRLTLGIQHPPFSAREYFERFADEMGKDNPAQRQALLRAQEALKNAPANVNGLLVLDVAPDSNAARMGWRTGDIILSIDGQRLGHNVSSHGVNWRYVDENVTFGVFRNGETLTTQYQGTR